MVYYETWHNQQPSFKSNILRFTNGVKMIVYDCFLSTRNSTEEMRKRHLLEEGGKFLAVLNTCKIVIIIGLNSDTTTHVLLFIV